MDNRKCSRWPAAWRWRRICSCWMSRFSGVHPDMIAKMLALITQLAVAGKTILFIEHNIEAVMQVADHVMVMDAGRKIVEGPPQLIKDNPDILEAYLE